MAKRQGTWQAGQWYVNGSLVDLNAHWPVYSGPNLTIDKGKMALYDIDGGIYSIDYSGNVPVFMEEFNTSSLTQKSESINWH
ncbi:MAG: hypothetical protein HC896_05345 [Bacteroidales bacterium]|nr:hypothetical protein [Bacteroidales bacterium]